MPPHALSKSSFLKFEQCPKAFFFYKNMPFLRDKISTDKELTFKRGHEVGFFARQLFPGGVDVAAETDSAEAALRLTSELLATGQTVVYEATFMYNQVLIMVDILCVENGIYTAYEVKSSLRVSDFFMRDACLQYYVLKQALPAFNDLFLVTVNGSYIKKGEVNCRELFRRRSIKERAEENLQYFDFQVKAALLVLEQNLVPNIPVGPQCFRPYQCDFFGNCWKEELTSNSVFNLPLTSKETQFEWHRSGLKLIDQVPDELLQKEALLRIKNASLLNEPFYDLKALARFLGKVNGTVAAMDMEIWNPAIPELDGTSPFEQIPFLVAFYDKNKSSHYFAEHSTDQRQNFAEALVELAAPYNTLLVYDKNLELNILRDLQARFPALAKELEAVKKKIVDVFDVFLKMHYYHPGFRNSFSLKVTSAVLLGDMDYGRITSGLEAMSFYNTFRGTQNPIEQEHLRDMLVHYCVTDCRATFLLYDHLSNLHKQKTPSLH